MRLGFLAFAVSWLGCSSTTVIAPAAPLQDAGTSTDAAVDAPYEPSPLLTDRPYTVRAPKAYDAAKPTSLVLAFHGYGTGDDGALLERYFQLAPVAEKSVFLYVTPEGTFDKDHQRFWNGTDACCDFYKSGVDDVAYVRALLDDVAQKYNVDPKRVFVTGLSAGGVFAHRLACELADRIAAVVSVSGTTFNDATRCKPAAGLSMVEVHGDQDDTVVYDGGTSTFALVSADYPSARDTVAHWATYNGCTGALAATGQTLDLDSRIAGAETRIEKYAGCTRGDVELWTIQGGPHAPHLSSAWGQTVWDYFVAHPKP